MRLPAKHTKGSKTAEKWEISGREWLKEGSNESKSHEQANGLKIKKSQAFLSPLSISFFWTLYGFMQILNHCQCEFFSK